jgi:hypothetical protein
MITCVSERSGIASRGTLRSDHTASAMVTPVNIKTMNLFRAENSMMRSIMARP